MGKIILKPCATIEKAEKALTFLRRGTYVEVDCFDTLDEILSRLTTLEEHALVVQTTRGDFPAVLLKELRCITPNLASYKKL